MQDSNILPMVSVIMPIRNEANFIARTLDAVLAQDYPPDLLEILVVDGMSDDSTREVIEKTVQLKKARRAGASVIEDNAAVILPLVKILDNPGRIVPTAFNIGLKYARGDIIVRVDGHCEIQRDYVRRCVQLLQETGADNVGGLQYAEGEDTLSRAIALATSSPFGVGGARFHYARTPAWVDTVFLGAYRKDIFDRLGGFDEELVRNQDDEFNFRLCQAGGKIWLDPSLQTIYANRTGFKKLWRQYFQYGLYKVRVIQKRGGVASWRHLIPGAFVAALFGGIFLAMVLGESSLLKLVIVPYAIANVAASLWTARRDWHLLPLLPLAFVILHLSYGLGFLWGVWRWRRYGNLKFKKSSLEISGM